MAAAVGAVWDWVGVVLSSGGGCCLGCFEGKFVSGYTGTSSGIAMEKEMTLSDGG